jgi:hypothetical protein
MSSDDRIQQIRERAYQIWESEGRPEGNSTEHWYAAERELQENKGSPAEEEISSDEAGIQAAREYDNAVEQFDQNGRVDLSAQEAKEAVEGPEGASLKEAESIGKRRRKGEDLGGNR